MEIHRSFSRCGSDVTSIPSLPQLRYKALRHPHCIAQSVFRTHRLMAMYYRLLDMDRYEREQAIRELDTVNPTFREIDWQIIDALEEGQQTRQQLAERLDVTGEYIYKRIDTLKTIGLVEVLHEGFYALPEHRGIAVTEETRDRLSERKASDESFDALVSRILDETAD